MRVSDAERTEVADCLSKHYGDGRLDEAEFNRRLDLAMHATIQSDLDGLFADLPGGGPPGLQHETAPGPQGSGSKSPAGPAGRPGRGGRPLSLRRVASLALLVVITIVVAHALAHLFIPWVLIAVLIFAWFQFGGGRRRGSPRA
jgi:hypothetical protein